MDENLVSERKGSVSILDSCYKLLKGCVKKKGGLCFWEILMVKSVEMDDVIGMFGEDVCNPRANRLVSFLNKVDIRNI